MGYLLGLHGKVVNSLFLVEVHLAIKLVHRYHLTFNDVKVLRRSQLFFVYLSCNSRRF